MSGIDYRLGSYAQNVSIAGAIGAGGGDGPADEPGTETLRVTKNPPTLLTVDAESITASDNSWFGGGVWVHTLEFTPSITGQFVCPLPIWGYEIDAADQYVELYYGTVAGVDYPNPVGSDPAPAEWTGGGTTNTDGRGTYGRITVNAGTTYTIIVVDWSGASHLGGTVDIAPILDAMDAYTIGLTRQVAAKCVDGKWRNIALLTDAPSDGGGAPAPTLPRSLMEPEYIVQLLAHWDTDHWTDLTPVSGTLWPNNGMANPLTGSRFAAASDQISGSDPYDPDSRYAVAQISGLYMSKPFLYQATIIMGGETSQQVDWGILAGIDAAGWSDQRFSTIRSTEATAGQGYSFEGSVTSPILIGNGPLYLTLDRSDNVWPNDNSFISVTIRRFNDIDYR